MASSILPSIVATRPGSELKARELALFGGITIPLFVRDASLRSDRPGSPIGELLARSRQSAARPHLPYFVILNFLHTLFINNYTAFTGGLVSSRAEYVLGATLMEVDMLRLLAAAGTTALLLVGSSAQAMPAASAEGDGARIVLVSGGCGPYAHRGPFGGCQPGGQWGYGPAVPPSERWVPVCPPGYHLGPYRRACWPN